MILAIDTATRQISLALHDGHTIIAEATWLSADHHTVELAPALCTLLAWTGTGPADLTALAVALGPGSYTGLRIGMSLAKGLSLAADPPLPIIGIPTLDIVAVAQPHLADQLCAVAQAGRSRINVGFYRWHADAWRPQESPRITTWEALVEHITEPTQVAGEIDTVGRRILASLGEHGIISGAAVGLRRASFLADLALRRLENGERGNPATIAPVYLG